MAILLSLRIGRRELRVDWLFDSEAGVLVLIGGGGRFEWWTVGGSAALSVRERKEKRLKAGWSCREGNPERRSSPGASLQGEMAVRRQRVEAAGLWEPSPSRRRRRWAVGEGEEEAAGEDCAVLTLSHFSRPPFVSFGTVRVGTSRARRLALENPNQEPVSVAVSRPPPPAKGFAVDQRPLLLQVGKGAREGLLRSLKTGEGAGSRGLIAVVSLRRSAR